MKKTIALIRRIATANPAPAESFKTMLPPPLRMVYDYQFCVEDEELEATIREINDRGYKLISVTQYGADPLQAPAGEPPVTSYARLLAMIGDLTELKTEAKDSLVAALNEMFTNGSNGSSADTGGNSGSDSTQNTTQAVACENLDLFYSAIIRRKANPKEPLAITTYDGGQNQPTHPKVLYFVNGWNGHKYWMVYTPYPNNNSFQENPCITYSDDGITWSEEGISNPIIASQNGGCWWSDPHLVYIPETDTMELWVRWCSNGADGMENGWEGVYRLESTDGVNWTEKEYLFHVVDTAWASVLSPSVIYEDGKYKIWFVYKRECLKYYESTDGTNWQYVKDISVNLTPLGNYKLWHFDMIKTTKGYEFVGCYQLNGQFDKNNYIAYSWSADNENFEPAVCVLANGASGRFDDLELYRPCLVKVGNKYRMYYGAQKNIKIWHIGVVEAPTMELLNELLAANTTAELPTYSTDDSGGDDVSAVAASFDESEWTSGFYNDSGVLSESGDMHHSDLMPIATAGGTVTTTVSSTAILRISYFDADYVHLGWDRGAGLNINTTDYDLMEIDVLTNVEGAVYYAISCNTADKSAVAVTVGGSDSGDSGSGGESDGETEAVTYTITNKLTNVTSNNSTASVTENKAYTATLTAADGYELDTVTVTMGGTDVTSTVYAEGKITIAAVTGNVVITASATSVQSGISAVVNSFDESAWTEGYYYNNGVLTESNSVYVSSFITLPTEVQYVHCKNTSNIYMCITYFDADKNYLESDRGGDTIGTTQTIALRTDVENAVYYTVSAFATKDAMYVDSIDKVLYTANTFDESAWTEGYYNDSGVIQKTASLHHSDLMPIATAGGTVSTTVTADSYLRISYFDGSGNLLEFDMGGSYNASNLTVKTDVENAVYYAISCNTADKSAVTVS